MSKKDWTDELRDRLADYEAPVSEDLWASIEQSLAQQKKEQPTSSPTPVVHISPRGWKRWSIAAAMTALLLGGSYVYLQQDSQVASMGSDDYKAQHGDVSRQGGNASLDIASTMPEQQLLADASMPSSHTSMTSKVAQILGVMESAEQQTVKDVSPTTEESPATADNHDDTPAYQKMKQSEPLASSYHQETTPSYTSRRKNISSVSMKLYAENGIVMTNQSQESRLFSSNMPQNSPTDDFSPAFNENHKTPILASANQLGVSPYAKVEHHRPISVGLQVGIPMETNLTISTGLVYTKVASDFYSDTYGNGNVTTQNLHYIGIPVSASYEVWGTKTLHTYASLGGEADFNVKNQTESDGEHLTQSPKDKTQWSAHAAVGVQYDIFPQVGVYLEPGMKYYFDNGSQVENIFKDKKLNFNLQFGLRLNLK